MLNTGIAGQVESFAPPALFPDAGQCDDSSLEPDAIAAPPDEAERERLILAHLQDVRQIARNIVRRLPSSVQLEDLVQAGTIGLIDAANRFDRSRPLLFSQYARIRITGAIYDTLRDLDWASRYMRTRQQKLENAAAQLENSLGRQPSSDEVAEAMGMDLDTFYEFASAVQEIQKIELDAQVSDEACGRDRLLANAEQAPDAVLEQKEMSEHLRQHVNRLPADEREVMLLYYFCDWRMEAIGRRIRRTESRVSQIHSKAIARLRQRLSAGLRTPASRRRRREATGRPL